MTPLARDSSPPFYRTLDARRLFKCDNSNNEHGLLQHNRWHLLTSVNLASFFPVSVIHSNGDLLDARIERHYFKSFEHGDKKRALASKIFDWCFKIYRLFDIEIDETDEHLLLRCVLLRLHLLACLITIVHIINEQL